VKKFFLGYWQRLKALPKNPFVYVWFLLILDGGHTPRGKALAIVISILIAPLFQEPDEDPKKIRPD
jgi:hypothetical protein